MAKYIVVIRTESKYFRYINEHKVTNLLMFHLEGGKAEMKIYQPFLNYESGSIDKREFNKTHFWNLGLFPDLGSIREINTHQRRDHLMCAITKASKYWWTESRLINSVIGQGTCWEVSNNMQSHVEQVLHARGGDGTSSRQDSKLERNQEPGMTGDFR